MAIGEEGRRGWQKAWLNLSQPSSPHPSDHENEAAGEEHVFLLSLHWEVRRKSASRRWLQMRWKCKGRQVQRCSSEA